LAIMVASVLTHKKYTRAASYDGGGRMYLGELPLHAKSSEGGTLEGH